MFFIWFQFHGGYSETVLFDSWKFSTIGGLVGSMIGIFFMAALYEGLKYYRYVIVSFIYSICQVMLSSIYIYFLQYFFLSVSIFKRINICLYY